MPLTRVKPTRLHQIIPVGTEDFIADEDEWTNPRRRNKKLSFRWVGKTTFEIMPLGTSVSNVNGEPFPTMPTIPFKSEHREKLASYEFTKSELDMIMAMVARPVNKKELAENPDAQKSLDVAWDKLMDKKAWDMDHPREWAEVSAEAVRRGRKAHVGRVFEICVEKSSELPKGSSLRKFKGRTVFQGNNVQDENSNTALFSELGSSPASMEAGKVLDAYGSQPGFACEQADGKQAYTQTTLKGAETWVRLPRERWPRSWIGKFKDPVVRLRLAL